MRRGLTKGMEYAQNVIKDWKRETNVPQDEKSGLIYAKNVPLIPDTPPPIIIRYIAFQNMIRIMILISSEKVIHP
jgi:hypothetical protein